MVIHFTHARWHSEAQCLTTTCMALLVYSFLSVTKQAYHLTADLARAAAERGGTIGDAHAASHAEVSAGGSAHVNDVSIPHPGGDGLRVLLSDVEAPGRVRTGMRCRSTNGRLMHPRTHRAALPDAWSKSSGSDQLDGEWGATSRGSLDRLVTDMLRRGGANFRFGDFYVGTLYDRARNDRRNHRDGRPGRYVTHSEVNDHVVRDSVVGATHCSDSVAIQAGRPGVLAADRVAAEDHRSSAVAVLGVLAIPVLIILLLFGLPIFLVLVAGSMLMGLIGVVLTIGIAALKFGLFIVLPIWLLWKLGGKMSCWIFNRGDSDTPPSGSTPSADSSAGPTTGPISDPSD